MPAKKKKPPSRNGLGSLYVDAKGRFVAEINLGRTLEGKRKTKKKYMPYGTTKREAEQALAELLADAGRGVLQDPTSMSVAQWLEQHLARRHVGKATSTITENNRLASKINAVLGTKKVQSVEPWMLQQFMDGLEAGMSQRTKLKIAQLLRSALSEAVALEVITRNPAANVKVPRAATKEDHGIALSREQAKQLLQAAKSYRLAAFFELLLMTGMRVGEAQALKVSDVDFAAKNLKIQRTASSRGGHVEITTGKTEAARRTVPLSDALLEMLGIWLARVDRERAQAASLWDEGGWLFPSSSGTLMIYRNIYRDLAKICVKAKLEPIAPHDLRRTFITLAIRQGIAPEIVSKMVGHKDIAMTLAVYRKVADEEVQTAELKL